MITAALSFLLLYKYVALFLIVFAVAVIVPLPINILLLATGAFSSFGYFNFFISISIVVVASMLGDSVDYSIARYYGPVIFEKIHIKNNYYFGRLEKMLYKNAGFTIFITRFLGTLNQLISFFSGVAKVPFRKFIMYDFLGNFVSTVLVMGIGYVAGGYWQNFSGLVDIASWMLATIIIIVVGVTVFLKHKHTRSEKY